MPEIIRPIPQMNGMTKLRLPQIQVEPSVRQKDPVDIMKYDERRERDKTHRYDSGYVSKNT
jgi:hypothetical protein